MTCELQSMTGVSAFVLQAALLAENAIQQVDLQEHESAAEEVVDIAAVAARADVAQANQLQKAAERQAHLLDKLICYRVTLHETSLQADAGASSMCACLVLICSQKYGKALRSAHTDSPKSARACVHDVALLRTSRRACQQPHVC